jgi:hypothetical protein
MVQCTVFIPIALFHIARYHKRFWQWLAGAKATSAPRSAVARLLQIAPTTCNENVALSNRREGPLKRSHEVLKQ